MSSKRSLDYSKDVATPFDDGRLDAPAYHRNKGAILDVLKSHATTRHANILEIASGTGQHAAFYGAAFPQATWWPSDFNPIHLKSIDAWVGHAGVSNVKAASLVDVTSHSWLSGDAGDDWPAAFDAIIAANMIHIAPWAAATGLIEGAAKRLSATGALFIYGPFMRDGKHSAPSNQAFDESLKSRDPSWGVRDITEVEKVADQHGLELTGTIEMPANNLTLVLRPKSKDRP